MTAPDWRRDAGFEEPDRIPWSELGPEFAAAWGHVDPGDFQPEFLEIIGQNGSGKTHLLGKIFQERAHVYPDRAHILFGTKADDATLFKTGWPIVEDWRGVQDNRCCIYWPQTKLLEEARDQFYEARIADVLKRLWVKDSNTSVALDDWGYLDTLARVKRLLSQFLREGRSLGLDTTAMKQRPQGSNRLMSSETHWTVAFAPKDRADLERWSELFGSRRDWMPVFDQMDGTRREFLIRHNRTKLSAISWVDEPLVAVVPDEKRKRGLVQMLGWRTA
jgi:hypothetical protein